MGMIRPYDLENSWVDHPRKSLTKAKVPSVVTSGEFRARLLSLIDPSMVHPKASSLNLAFTKMYWVWLISFDISEFKLFVQTT